MTSQTFGVNGMTCAHCVQAVTSGVTRVPGVSRVDVDLAGGTVTVESDEPIDASTMAAAIDEAGFELAS